MAGTTAGAALRRRALLLLLLSGCCGWFAQPAAAQLGKGVPAKGAFAVMVFYGNNCVRSENSYPTLILPNGECEYIDESFMSASVTQGADGRIHLRGYCDSSCSYCGFDSSFGPGVCVDAQNGLYATVQPVQDTELTVTVYSGRSCEYDGASITRASNECDVLPDNYASSTGDTSYVAVALDGGWAMLEWECDTGCPAGCPFRQRVEVNQCLPLPNSQSVRVTYPTNVGLWVGLSVAAAVLLFGAMLALSVWWSRKKEAQAAAAGGLDEQKGLLVNPNEPSAATGPAGVPQFSYAQLPAAGYGYNYTGGYDGSYGGVGTTTSGDAAGAAYAAYPPVEPGTYPPYPPTLASPTTAGGSAENAQ